MKKKFQDVAGVKNVLFKLQEDPGELHDLGTDPDYAPGSAELHEH